jgi:iron-sulfur cluster repair protein YtfE (RIC family)
MNASKLMAALNTVEQDHQFVLDKIQALKDGVACLLRPGEEDPHQVLRRLRESNDYLGTNFTAHMLEEEATLFPLLEEFKPAGAELVGRLRLEHEEIRGKLKDFANCLAVAFEVEDALPRAVLRDVLIDGWELWDLLDKHAHVETQAIKEYLTRYFVAEPASTAK